MVCTDAGTKGFWTDPGFIDAVLGLPERTSSKLWWRRFPAQQRVSRILEDSSVAASGTNRKREREEAEDDAADKPEPKDADSETEEYGA